MLLKKEGKCLKKKKKKRREKYKISPYGLPDLQFTPCGFKTNLKVPMVCKKKKKTI
jgi:hypothetical protein